MIATEVDRDRKKLEKLKAQLKQFDIEDKQDIRNELKARKKRLQYIQDNKIEFFGIVDPDLGLKGPNPKQKLLLDAWLNTLYEVFTFTGGNKLGKTTIGVVIAISVMIGYFPWDPRKTPIYIKNPPAKIRLVGQDWENHIKAVVIPALEEWWPKNRKLEHRNNNVGAKAYLKDLKSKVTLDVMSNKQEVGVYEGWKGHLVIYDEPPKREIRIACAKDLSVNEGRELFTATLLKEPWINREVIKAKNKDGTPKANIFNVHGEIYDNEGYGMTKKGIEMLADKLTDKEKQERLKGIPSYLSGLIYGEFDRQVHIKKRFDIPLDWIIDIAIDCHPSKEQAILFMATDPRNYKYLVDEIWSHGDGTWVGEEIMRRVNRYSYRVNRVLIDHSAKGNANEKFTTYEKIETVLWRYGHGLYTYRKDEDGGIKTARTLLKGPNNEPALFIFSDLTRTIFEIEGYMIDPKTGKTQDYDNDMMDNLYALANEDTQWYSPEMNDIEEPEHTGNLNRNEVTGY